MRGLFLRSLRDAVGVTSWCALGFFLFGVVFVPIAWKFQGQLIGPVLQIEFVRGMLRALVGSDIGDSLGPAGLGAIAWAHPAVLALLWAQAIALATRAPAGTIDRATIDFLLGLPVTRRAFYLAESAACAVAAGVVLAAGAAGHACGSLFLPVESRMAAATVGAILVNLAALQAAVLGIAFLLSAASSRRGRAVAVAFAVVLVSFLLGFLAQLWEPARPLGHISLMSYYRPLAIAQDATAGPPWRDVAVLATVATAAWAGGWAVFSRRDIATV